jgi:DNA-binding SARP family transcriptional activator/tetratricopeptide (TPR) repeat protein
MWWRSGRRAGCLWFAVRMRGHEGITLGSDRDGLWVNVLGPLEVWRDGRPVKVSAGGLSVALAVLATSAREAVSVLALARYVWGERLPKRVPGAVQGLVLRLRQLLGAAAVTTVTQGYRLELEPDRVDLLRFRRLMREAGRAGAAESARLLDAALGLWRGEPFQGLDSDALGRDYTDQLVEERLAAVHQHIELELAAGHHRAVVPRLRRLTGQYPLRETLWHQLILALVGDGRQAEAVAAYHQARETLAEQLGTDPSAELQATYQALLRGGPVDVAPAGPAVVPRQLPAAPRAFVGRKQELARLADALVDGERAAGAAVIVGAGGLGKTWLALRWAHDNLDRFPDGQLYIDLRAFDPSTAPTPVGAALRGFLEALGVAREEVPLDLDAQVGLYRSLTAGRRLLVVLDNALDTAHVRPLLPDTRSGVVLVTGRREFGGMLTAHGATRIGLDVLAEPDAYELLVRQLEPAAVAGEPEAVAALLAHCAGLPLAISIVAARAASQPTFPLAALASELGAASSRLDALSAGELAANLRAAFATSHRMLDAATARGFGLLGLTPTADLDVAAAAALTGLPPERARALLRELEAAHLIAQHVPGRYRMHDLIRLYAAETAPDDPAALPRLVDFYLHTAFRGERQLAPLRPPAELDAPAAGARPLELPDVAAAFRWFDTERANLLAVHRLAVERGWHARVWQLTWSLGSYHWRRAGLVDNLTIWRAAAEATVRLGAPALEAQARRRWGLAAGRAGDFEEADRQQGRALLLAEEAGDTVSWANTHQTLAWLWARRGDDARALGHALLALDRLRDTEDEVCRAGAFNIAGWYHARAGNHEEAERHCRVALDLYRRHDDVEGQADTLDSLGLAALGTGRHAEALDHYRAALALFREVGHAYEEANTLASIGEALRALDRPAEARDAWRQALAMYRDQHRTADIQRLEQRLAG